jgi:signal transduction histidine kinase
MYLRNYKCSFYKFGLALILFFAINQASSQPAYTDSLLQVIEKSKDKSERFTALVNLSRTLSGKNQDSARKLLQSASQLIDYQNDVNLSRYYNSWGLYYWYNREFDSAMGQYAKVFELPETDKLLPNLAEAANNLGTLINRKGNTDSAGKLLHEALRIDRQRNYLEGIAKTNYDLGNFYYRQDKFELALRHILESIEHHEMVQDSFRLGHAVNVLGNIYLSLNDTVKALETYKRGEHIAQDIGDDSMESTLSNNIFSLLKIETNSLKEALAYGNKALAHAIERDDEGLILTLYTNFGALYSIHGDYNKSMEYYRLARSYEDREDVKSVLLAGLYFLKGDLHRKMQEHDSARYFFNKSLDISNAINSKRYQWQNLSELSRLDSLQGNYLQALAKYQESVAIKDSIWKLDNKNRIAELQIIYETDKKAAENLILKESNALKEKVIVNQQRILVFGVAAFMFFALFLINLLRSRKKLRMYNIRLEEKNKEILQKQNEINRYNQDLLKQREELITLNQTKDKFFSIISHDLRGPFSGLINLLDLVINEFDTMSSEEKKAMLSTMHRSSVNTYNLLVNLLEWSQAQQGKLSCKPVETKIAYVLQDALHVLSSRIETKNHTIVNHISEELTVYCDPDITKSIFINLINNAIKFTANHGLIELYSEMENGQAKIYVRDNGTGIKETDIQELFKLGAEVKRKGTDGELGTGLGLVMVKNFVEMQHGSISVESKEGQGSVFMFTLPLSPQ